MSAAAEEAKWTQIQEDVAQSPSARSRSHLSIPRWVYGLLGGLALSFLFFRWIASKPFSTSRVTPAIPPPEATNSQPRAITPRGTASRPVSRPSTTPSHSISPVRDAMPSERPREPDSSAQRELDREREREDRDRDRERDGEQREEERPAEGDAVEARSNDDPNFEDSRAPQSKSANRPTFRRKAGGSIPGESGGAGSSDELREEPREEAPPANE